MQPLPYRVLAGASFFLLLATKTMELKRWQ